MVETVEYNSETGWDILNIRKYSSNPKIYDRLTSLLTKNQWLVERSYVDMVSYAHRGDIGMIRHLLDLGTPVQHGDYFETPLLMACRGLHHDIVDLLLQRGADLHYHQHLWPVFPFHEAAVASSPSLARRLLDHGANPNRGIPGELREVPTGNILRYGGLLRGRMRR
jgi:hypothetical protein